MSNMISNHDTIEPALDKEDFKGLNNDNKSFSNNDYRLNEKDISVE